MKASQQAGFGQALHVPAHGLERHAQFLGEFLHRDRTADPDDIEQLELPGIGIHLDFLDAVWLVLG